MCAVWVSVSIVGGAAISLKVLSKFGRSLVSSVLTELNLAYCHIGAEGATAIAKALEVNSVLTNLNLARNQLCGLDEYGKKAFLVRFSEKIIPFCQFA